MKNHSSRPLARVVASLCVVGAVSGYWLGLRPVLVGGAGPAAAAGYDPAQGPSVFVETSAQAGIAHVHEKPALDPRLDGIMNWVSSVGAAAAAADYDGDGRVDLYVTNSRKERPNFLYRNRGDGTFEELGEALGVAWLNGADGASMDCVWGDYDNDGDPDLYVVMWGRDRLLRNDGALGFVDVTEAAFSGPDGSAGSPWANGCAAVWVDYDGDSWLDLYVGNYFAPQDLWHLEHTRILHDDFESARNAGRNALYRNRGDGTFEELGAELGVDDPGWTLGVGHGDFNNDGWPDLYCADDFGPDQLFLNTGAGGFEDVSDVAIGRDTKKGMNVECGDYDGDGWLDVHVSNITTGEYLRECNMLWQHRGLSAGGVPLYQDVALESGVCDGGWAWGAKFLDYDNDGDLDLVGLNGFISDGPGSYWYDLASWTVTGDDVADALNWPPIDGRSFSGYEPARLWRNDGGRFEEVAAQAGLASVRDGRGVVAFDYDDDGDLDLYLANQGQPPELFRNDAGGAGNHLVLVLEGAPEHGSNRSAIGARVSVVTAAGVQLRELDGGNSYCGQSDRRLFFGLGGEAVAREVEIRWPSRRVQRLRDVRANQVLVVREAADLGRESTWIPTEKAARPTAAAVEAAAPRLSEAEREALIGDLEASVRRDLGDLALASRYRRQCAQLGAHDRSIAFFEELARAHPRVPNVRLQLASAYVDKIPTCGGMAAVVSKGTLARKSLDQLDPLIAEDASWWPALYSRATNHLYWPRALLHSTDAARDFERLVALGEADPGGARPYHLRAYLGLGDAWAKHGDFEAARSAWRRGAARFPDSEALRSRLALADAGAALTFVEREFSLEREIDTDYSFFVLQ